MIKACVFDAFGTLFQLDLPPDVITNKRAVEALQICRQKQLEYSWLYNQMGNYLPFEKITEIALKYAVEKVDLEDIALEPALSEVEVRKLKTIFFTPNYYGDVLETISTLKKEKITCGILSNGSVKMLSEVLKHTQLENTFDFVLSADAAKTFKPNPKVYAIALHHLRIPKEEILFVSSNQWDVSGANAFGFKTAWVNRNEHLKEPILANDSTLLLKTLSDIPLLIDELGIGTS
ncbi:haloacid dehalogenase type II [Maribacter sp. 2210JD10-5]|uniref:haloacid dehalogenase type II n=1 Tax=Maribacter sp. 2210JD10-5 TaxID=3386272 RepID=UPI0039BD3C5C